MSEVSRRMSQYPVKEEAVNIEDLTDEELKERGLTKAVKKTIEALTDKCMIRVLQFLPHKLVLKVAALVCQKWRTLINDPEMWQVVSCRPQYDGMNISSADTLLQMIAKWNQLRWIELSPELITPAVIQDLANRCPKLNYLTLDFSTAAQLHDFTDLQSFPSRLKKLTLCLSENIFLEGLMRKIYTYIASVETLDIVGTYEKVEDEEEEVYETVNIHKLKQYLPNLRVVNLWGVAFVTDDHVDSLSANCAKLECLCVNFCNKVSGSSIKMIATRCKNLTSLMAAHALLDSTIIQEVPWEQTNIDELDISATELTSEALLSTLTRCTQLRWLKAGFLEHFTDDVLRGWSESGAANGIEYLDLDTCDSITDAAMDEFLTRHGHQLKALVLGGHHKLTENFWMKTFPKLPNVELLVMGISEDCCAKVTSKITVDQFIDCISKNAKGLKRMELRWDDETLRFADKSSKFIDVMRLRCQKLHSIVLADGQYYEIVRSNFERAGRESVVRSTEMSHTNTYGYLKHYYNLLFN